MKWISVEYELPEYKKTVMLAMKDVTFNVHNNGEDVETLSVGEGNRDSTNEIGDIYYLHEKRRRVHSGKAIYSMNESDPEVTHWSEMPDHPSIEKEWNGLGM